MSIRPGLRHGIANHLVAVLSMLVRPVKMLVNIKKDLVFFKLCSWSYVVNVMLKSVTISSYCHPLFHNAQEAESGMAMNKTLMKQRQPETIRAGHVFGVTSPEKFVLGKWRLLQKRQKIL